MVLTIESTVRVPGLTGMELTNFLLECTDEAYQAWWPGVHLHFHAVTAGHAGHLGQNVVMDEFIGSRRVRAGGVVRQVDPGRKLLWQMKKGISLPVWLTVNLTDGGDGVTIRHTVTAGWTGVGRLLDPLFGLYFTREFARAMDRHVHTEFPLLRDHLHPAAKDRSEL